MTCRSSQLAASWERNALETSTRGRVSSATCLLQSGRRHLVLRIDNNAAALSRVLQPRTAVGGRCSDQQQSEAYQKDHYELCKVAIAGRTRKFFEVG
eukprot:scaffold4387_cov400-Prasinococcus_capsulatus_cf.AAC.12